MNIKRFFKFSAMGFALTLAGCETIDLFPERQQGGTLMRDVPVLPAEQPPVTPSLPEAPSAVASSLVIYVSSTSPVSGFIPVQQSGQLVYVDPSQTLTRNDLQNVIAKVDASGNAFVDLHFSGYGSEKLSAFTRNNVGKSLTVTMNNKLVSILGISSPIQTGHLFVPMSSPEQASALEQQIQDGD
ncbi:MAG: hypothetical protein GX070_03265 [Alcaligenaceae bacterium]|nr:hypothetical protein [Alcaligenaceae bacterium]